MSGYAANVQVLFTNSAGTTDFWLSTAATTAGQTPDTNPTLWSIVSIPEVFFNYCIYASYADWLRMDGQTDKAAAMDEKADEMRVNQADIQERQMGYVPPLRVASYVTSQPRF